MKNGVSKTGFPDSLLDRVESNAATVRRSTRLDFGGWLSHGTQTLEGEDRTLP